MILRSAARPGRRSLYDNQAASHYSKEETKVKRTLFALLLALAMIVCFAAFTASAEETTEHVHCVCGGCAVGVQDHVCEDITWQPLPEGTTDFGTLTSGNYYLTGDVTVTAASRIPTGSARFFASSQRSRYSSSTTSYTGLSSKQSIAANTASF